MHPQENLEFKDHDNQCTERGKKDTTGEEIKIIISDKLNEESKN